MKRVLFFAAMMAAPAFAQPTVAIHADAQPREIYIGDPILFGLFVTVSSDVAQEPFVLPQPLENFDLLDASTPTVTTDKEGKSTAVYRFVLTTFSTGPVTLPSMPVRFSSDAERVVEEGKTEPITIHVKSLLQEKGDEGNLRPLKGLFNFKSYFWLWLTLGLLGAGTAGYFLWAWLSGKTRAGAEKPSGPPRPAEELAWEAIHRLEDTDLIAQGNVKEFYFRLSEILRAYLERRYGMSALDRTSSELLSDFRRRNFTLTLVNLCRAFFDNADLVKFAKFTPTEEEILNDLNQVKQFINLTTPQKSAPAEEKIPL